jgi:ribosomal protein S18 acetylase RimI-like enzyme
VVQTEGPRAAVLIDSNIFIAAEDHGVEGHVHGTDAATLIRLVNELGYELVVSNGTRSDILAADATRRSRMGRSLERYTVLHPVPENSRIRAQFPSDLSGNDRADVEVLSTFATGRATWLVSQDRRLRHRADRAGLANVLSLDDALAMFSALRDPYALRLPTARIVEAYTIDQTSNIFDSLKTDYHTFVNWWTSKVVAERRDVVIIGESADPEGLAVLKVENDRPYGLPDPVVKICTFKISDEHRGDKRGELLLKSCVMHARDHQMPAVYVEVLPSKVELIDWLQRFGFAIVGRADAPDGQFVLTKLLEPEPGSERLGPLDHAVAYGPGSILLDRAHAVPIRDHWHRRLLPEAEPPAAPGLFDIGYGAEGCGNAILKAYLCNASTRRIAPGDGVVFIRTNDPPAMITSVGVVEQTLVSRSVDEIAAFVGTRTVYSRREIADLCRQPREVLAILFRFDRALSEPIAVAELIAAGHLNGTVQSITQMSQEAVAWLRQQLDG